MCAYLALYLDGAGCLGDRFGGAGQGEELGAVGAGVGQSQDAARGLVTGCRVVEVAAGGVEVEGEPAGEVAQPGDVAAELVLIRRGERVELGGKFLSVAEAALAHVEVGGPESRGQPWRPGAVLPDVGEDIERCAGVPGYALAVAGRHGQARGDQGVHGHGGRGHASRECSDRGCVTEPDGGLGAQAPQGPGSIAGCRWRLAGWPATVPGRPRCRLRCRALPGGPPGRRTGAGPGR